MKYRMDSEPCQAALEIVREAVNRTRIEMQEQERRGDPVNIHDVFAIFSAKLNEVWT
jgi:hypothetical protein